MRPCVGCGVPNAALRNGKCPACIKPHNTPSPRKRGYDYQYDRNRTAMVNDAWDKGLPCVLCGQGFSSKRDITAEHLIAKRHGGSNRRDNLGPAHKECNSGWRNNERTPCAVCSTPTSSPYGVCSKTPQCRREHKRRRVANGNT